MSVDLPRLYGVLKDKTRARILDLLGERDSLSYVELQNLLGITHTGKLNYHLRVLGDLIVKDEQSREYRLSEKGKLSVALLGEFRTSYESRSRDKRDLLLVILLSLIGVVLARVFFPSTPTLAYTLASAAVGVLILGAIYYLFAKGTLRQARAAYIIMWGIALAFPFWVIFTQIYRMLAGSLLEGPLNVVIYVACVAFGGFIGDRAGRRLNYRVWGRQFREEADSASG